MLDVLDVSGFLFLFKLNLLIFFQNIIVFFVEFLEFGSDVRMPAGWMPAGWLIGWFSMSSASYLLFEVLSFKFETHSFNEQMNI